MLHTVPTPVMNTAAASFLIRVPLWYYSSCLCELRVLHKPKTSTGPAAHPHTWLHTTRTHFGSLPAASTSCAFVTMRASTLVALVVSTMAIFGMVAAQDPTNQLTTVSVAEIPSNRAATALRAGFTKTTTNHEGGLLLTQPHHHCDTPASPSRRNNYCRQLCQRQGPPCQGRGHWQGLCHRIRAGRHPGGRGQHWSHTGAPGCTRRRCCRRPSELGGSGQC